MYDKLVLDERLGAAAELVPEGTVLLDVGTDHGYLPVKLILDGKIEKAGASDINSAPLKKAVATAEKYGVCDKVSFYLADGFSGISDMNSYTAVSICGMGGELISRIISEADQLKTDRIPLILQPMSSVEELSLFLAQHGFNIADERIAYAAGKVYRVILAKYDGNVRVLSDVEHILGHINIVLGKRQKNFGLLLCKNIAKYQKMISGMTLGGVDCTNEKHILEELCLIADREEIKYEDK